MEIKEITINAILVAKQTDGMGYTTYVFENLEYDNIDYKYIMCVRFPNWNHRILQINDKGYVTFKYVEAGLDKWYDGSDMIPYKYTNVIFLKFIDKDDSIQEQIVLD